MPNYPLLSIPIYYILSLAPHAYAVALASKSTKWNNANPRSTNTIQTLQQKLGPTTFGKFERAESAHKNSIENLPLFVAAVTAGLLAEKVGGEDVGTTRFVGLWLAVRSAYILLYINIENVKYSPARSWMFMLGIGLAFYQIYKSAVALG